MKQLVLKVILKNFKKIDFLGKKQNIITPPKKKKLITVLKSPHVFKKSREQFLYSYNKKNIYYKKKDIIKFFYLLIKINKKFHNYSLKNFKIIC